MAYNYYPSTYNPYFPTYQQQIAQAQIPQQATQPQIQNGGFITVRSAQEAYNYPVAIGNSVTFKDETAPYIYVKTRGFSQLEEPIFEQFQLVKVDNQKQAEMPVQEGQNQSSKSIEYAVKSDLTELWSDLEALKMQSASFTAVSAVKDE